MGARGMLDRTGLAGGLREAIDLIQPRALVRSVLNGSWILLRLLARCLRTGTGRLLGRAAPQPPATGSEDGEAKNGGQPVKNAQPSSRFRRAGHVTDQLGIAALGGMVVVGVLGSILGPLLVVLRPYASVALEAFVVLWIVAALTADAATRPGADHEKDAGEEPQEDETEETGEETEEAPAGESWDVVRKRLLLFVEQRVAAGAAGFTEGVKGRGARVDDLLAEQQRHGGLPGMERKGMVELLERIGVTVREQMKFSVLEETPAGWKWKPRNVPGVHVEDLAQGLGRTPRLPPHLVPDNTPGAPPVAAGNPGGNVIPIPLARAVGE